jgi:hypothetical protein
MIKDNVKYFYVYYSYEPWGRGYIGKRECWCPPEEDSKYFGSFHDKTFKPTEKIILEVFSTRKLAYEAEVALHKFYNVKNNYHFANKTNQNLDKSKAYRTKQIKIYDKIFRDKFIFYVKESKSLREVLLKLNLKETGGNYTSIKKWIKLLNLDTSHFTGQASNKGKKFLKRTEEYKEKNCYKYIYTIITPAGKTIITKNLSEFCRINKLNKRNMWLASVGRIKSCKGYKITRKEL